MTYSNLDQRMSGKFYLPEDRVRFLRNLERQVRESRASFKAKKARERRSQASRQKKA